MKIEVNRDLFYILAGLTASGADAYDHNDTEVSALAERIVNSDIAEDKRQWFSRARTGQVAVNPYWPRGSAIAAACFFMDNGRFDIDACFSFFESTGAMNDPISADDFRAWISELPETLAYFEETGIIRPLWDEYRRITDFRMPAWKLALEETASAAAAFFGGGVPEMTFSPNLFSIYNTDFVRIGNRIIVIASEPDAESMLHETLHTVVAAHREKIAEYSKEYGLTGFADREKMMEYGYMTDDSADSMTHAIEECFVRAISAVLANKNDERLRVHAEFGCVGVPGIAALFKTMRPTVNEMGAFIDAALSYK